MDGLHTSPPRPVDYFRKSHISKCRSAFMAQPGNTWRDRRRVVVSLEPTLPPEVPKVALAWQQFFSHPLTLHMTSDKPWSRKIIEVTNNDMQDTLLELSLRLSPISAAVSTLRCSHECGPTTLCSFTWGYR